MEITLYLALFLFLIPLYFLLAQRSSKRVPPGSLGLPIVGQTLDFLKAMRNNKEEEWWRERIQKYGPVSKLGLLGTPTVFLHGPTANKFVYTCDGNTLGYRQPTSLRRILGENNMFEGGPEDHKRVREALMINAVWFNSHLINAVSGSGRIWTAVDESGPLHAWHNAFTKCVSCCVNAFNECVSCHGQKHPAFNLPTCHGHGGISHLLNALCTPSFPIYQPSFQPSLKPKKLSACFLPQISGSFVLPILWSSSFGPFFSSCFPSAYS